MGVSDLVSSFVKVLYIHGTVMGFSEKVWRTFGFVFSTFHLSRLFCFHLGAALPKTIFFSFTRNLHICLMSDLWVMSSQRNKKEKRKQDKKNKKGNACMDSNLADCRFFRVILGFACHGLAR